MVSSKQITFESGGRKLVAEVLVPKGTKSVPFVLFLRGWGSGADDNAEYARSLAKRGFGAFLVGPGDAEAPGASVGGVREQHLHDAQAAYDALFELSESEATEIFAVGQSYGGYLAASLADTRPLAGVVLRAPALLPDRGKVRADRLWGAGYQAYRETVAPGWHNQALTALRKSQVPVLVVSSEKDEFIPVHTIMSYLAAASGPRAHHLIAGAGHELNRRQSVQFDRILREWLEARLALTYS